VLAGGFSDGVAILPENIAGFNETGIQPGVRSTHCVIRPISKNTQHEVSTGNRKTSTVMCTIMADGTSTWPIVIFKGANIQSQWGLGDKERNIANMW
jgi:hypothetical protein